ncbi:hypothetical protein [Amycolatopsis sp. GM8]|uniref:hypothetical protein n=1 Tax=Amycolatopsis sp. GM8 TaxID=2896530 RepID=UPI001F2820E4|nr:hypothetical protein [Amycolatopsis sp. GM8]
MDSIVAAAILKAATDEFGGVRIVVRDLGFLDRYKADPERPAAGAWFDEALYVDTRTEGGPDFAQALELLATVTAQRAAERAVLECAFDIDSTP